MSRKSPPSNPIAISSSSSSSSSRTSRHHSYRRPRRHHHVRDLPSEINDYIDYVPVAKSLNDNSLGCVPTVRRLHIVQEFANQVWQPDDSSAVCQCCGSMFSTLWRRRHHCRVCGELVCASCSATTESGMIHHKKNRLLVTSLDASIHKRTTQERVCVTCQPALHMLNRAYTAAMALSIVARHFPDVSPSDNLFNLFAHVSLVNKAFYVACSQLKKLLVSSQYIYGHPWNLAFKSRQSYRFHITRNLLLAMEPYLRHHDFYEYALTYYGIANSNPTQRLPCQDLLCRNVSHTRSMEIDMTNLFFNNAMCDWTLELAHAMTPTLLWRKKYDTVVHLVQRFRHQYLPMLFTWLHAFPFGVGYINKYKEIIPIQDWQTLHKEWDFFHRLCEVARTCKDNVHDARFKTLAKEVSQSPCKLPGYPTLQVVQIDVSSPKFRQARSSSRPFILPCRIYHSDTQTFTKETLLIKHKQSMGSDGFVHLYINYLKSVVHDASCLVTYPSIPIGPYAGIILMVNGSLDLSELTKTSTIQNKLYDATSNAHTSRNVINHRFATSVAFFTVLTCFIGLRDRIESNMMILPQESVLFHIDYEYMFGKQPPLKETIRHMSDAVGGFMHSIMRSSSSYRSAGSSRRASSSSSFSSSSSSKHRTSSSHFLEVGQDDDTIIMKPLLPDSVMSMLGGHGSRTYNECFVPSFNYFFQVFWNHRHVLYFASQYLTYFPSTTQASQLTDKEHNAFFLDLANVVLKGSDTYGEFASKVTMSSNQKTPWTEKWLTKVSNWSRGKGS